MKKGINIVWVIITIGVIMLSGCWNNPSNQKEITIDSLYVDYADKITYHIRNYKDTEECVKKVFDSFERAEHSGVSFITNKKSTHIDHNYMYVDDDRTNRYTFSKYDSKPYTLKSFYISILDKKFKPVNIDITHQTDTTYFVGDFEELSFSALKSFDNALMYEENSHRKYHTYLLMNKHKEPKFELFYIRDGEYRSRTYKLY